MKREDIAVYALDSLLKAGAEKASCRTSCGRKDEFNIEANKFTLMRTLFNDELSLKVIKDKRKGVMLINKLDKDSVDKAVIDCIMLAESAVPDEAEDIAEKAENKNFDQSLGGASMDKLFVQTKDFLEQLKDQYPKIVLEGMSADFNSAKIRYINSNGVDFNSDKEYYQIGTMFSAKDGEKSSSFNSFEAVLATLDKPFIELDMHRTLLAESEKSLETIMADGKFNGKIIVTPACADMIWHTLFGCFLSDWSLIEGTSRWKDALNTKVADTKLTLRAVPLHPSVVAGERFTPDGFESQDQDIICDGMLKSFCLSLYGSRKTGKPRSLNSFSNIEVAPGDTPLEEMIKGIDRGLLLNRFSGAAPGPSGDMSGVAKNSFLIENGAISSALKETMVSFSIADILNNIIAISRERCTNGINVLPWCCFDGVTISGAV